MRPAVLAALLLSATLTEVQLCSGADSAYNVKYTTDFMWSQSPREDLSVPGAKTVSLSSCPAGVNAREAQYWIYIYGAGSPEAVNVTGGSCAGDGKPGTLQFTTANAHSAGYSIGSASSGLQEASIAAKAPMSSPTSAPQNGKVIVPPGTELKIYAPASILASAQTIDFSGAIFECYVGDSCVIVGDRRNSLAVQGVTITNPRGRPMVPHGTRSMIEVNAMKTRLFNVQTRSSSFGTFGHLVQVDDDEAFLLDGIDPSLGDELRCDVTFCGSTVYAPGPFGPGDGHPAYAAVGYIKHGNFSMNNSGNCIDWQSGNTLRVEDSVCQGFSQFGIRGGVKRGGYGGIELDNVYMEEYQGNSANPMGNVGQAGVLMQGGRLTIHSDRTPQGSQGKPFQNLGSTYYHYWIVASHATHGDSVPLALGWAKTDRATPVHLVWPKIAGIRGASRYKVLRLVWDGTSAKPVPIGKGDWLIGAVDPATCNASVCPFTDSQAAAASYTTVNQFSGDIYFPLLDYWPGNIVLGSLEDNQLSGSGATLVADQTPGGIVSVDRFRDGPVVRTLTLAGPGIGYGPEVSPSVETLESGPPSYWLKRGLILQSKSPADGGQFVNYKGRVNFLTLGSMPSPLVTWEDSNPAKTAMDQWRRPPADVADADTGMYASGILYTRANKEIRDYVGSLPDGTSWKEQLTAKQKIFAVPVVINNGNTLTLGSGSALSQMKIYTTIPVQRTIVPPQSCFDVMGTANGLSSADQITGITPPAPLGNLSLNAYPKGANAVTLHFCNPSTSNVNAPAGVYSFLAVR
jgi:hypothetical protein